ncbi:probable protein phosphatase 2C 23 [Elaeis guineensis]|uniref:protein-serine/threonine phosphatase n=1 Tax=Elaeis guineensis var. tenera TaxID=51953 RepID=A0A6I9R524_ELAGV|nr:probable protein phosphatase 2C 4 [Elaeis guineensis]
MGNGFAKLTPCFAGDGLALHGRRHISAAATSEAPGDESLGHSFCYVRPDLPLARSGSSKVHHSEETTTFRSISGAAVSANPATPLSTALLLPSELTCSSAASFESSTSFSSVPLQPVPRFSGPLSGPLAADYGFMSGPLASDRGFMSGPLAADRGFMSGPLADRAAGGIFSGPLDRPPSLSASSSGHFHRSLSQSLALRRRRRRLRPRRTAASLLRGAAKAIARTFSAASKLRAVSSPIRKSKESDDSKATETTHPSSGGSTTNPSSGIGGLTTHPSSSSDQMSVEGSEDSDSSEAPTSSLQWAQGKAGEDRVHVVVSEEHGWVFVGIYDGFNGPDATDYLLSNLYLAVHQELKGLLWEDKYDGSVPYDDSTGEFDITIATSQPGVDGCCKEGKRRWCKGVAEIWEEKHRRWNGEWDRERLELDRKLKEQLSRSSSRGAANHKEVLKALSQALRKTEAAYLDIADKMVSENPELALMGSCVLVMLMKGEDVYVMNVGDSRAVLARKVEQPDTQNSVGKVMQDLERMEEEMVHDLESYDGGDQMDGVPSLAALQLTLDHSTCIEEEVRRIKREHPEDPSAIVNDRVKGSLKVTRAFGAGFLKQPKWNNALLEMFRVDYIGTSPYISCSPHLFHHRLSPKDRFLLLSSDGLYQYFTNEEAVAEVEMFITTTPEGDPAQHLVEVVLFRAARKAGMDFHELLEIPQGVRRQYHDDVSIIVISLEGRIWRSWV